MNRAPTPARAVLLLTLLLATGGRAPAQGTQPAPDFADLERVAAAELKATNTPGAAVAVVRGDRVLFSRGFGVASVETGQAVTPDMLFRLGSTTKMFTAGTVVALAEQGKLRLDAPVGSAVPGLPAKLAQVTLHELLSHTAGLTDVAPMDGLHDDSALEANVRGWTDEYCFAERGEIHSYSNPGYVLAGLAAEKASGQPFADAVAAQLFQPLGMKRTTFRPTLAMTYPLALGHSVEEGKPAVVRPFADYAGAWPAGSMFSSGEDLSRWIIALLNGGKLEGRQVLSPTLLDRLSAPHAPIPGTDGKTHYGYGLRVEPFRGVRILSHGGSRTGYGSVMRLVPEHRFGVVVLANRSGASLVRTATRAMELCLPLQPEERPRAAAARPLDAAQIAAYAGVYSNPPNRLTVTARDGKLSLRQGGRDQELTHRGDHRFSLSGGDAAAQVVFVPGQDGRPAFLFRGGRALKRTSLSPN